MTTPDVPLASDRATGARARIIDTAYRLFWHHGIHRIGIDRIIAESDCAKATLYNQFGSKTELILAVLKEHQSRYAKSWLETEIDTRANNPVDRLLTVFDLLEDWLAQADFNGCLFLNVLVEGEDDNGVRQAAVDGLAEVRSIFRSLATDAGLVEPARFSAVWQMLMNGAIIEGKAGNSEAISEIRPVAIYLLENWHRV